MKITWTKALGGYCWTGTRDGRQTCAIIFWIPEKRSYSAWASGVDIGDDYPSLKAARAACWGAVWVYTNPASRL